MHLQLPSESVVAGWFIMTSGEMDEMTGVSPMGSLISTGWPKFVYIAVKGFQECDSRSCKASLSLGSERAQIHFH